MRVRNKKPEVNMFSKSQFVKNYASVTITGRTKAANIIH